MFNCQGVAVPDVFSCVGPWTQRPVLGSIHIRSGRSAQAQTTTARCRSDWSVTASVVTSMDQSEGTSHLPPTAVSATQTSHDTATSGQGSRSIPRGQVRQHPKRIAMSRLLLRSYADTSSFCLRISFSNSNLHKLRFPELIWSSMLYVIRY